MFKKTIKQHATEYMERCRQRQLDRKAKKSQAVLNRLDAAGLARDAEIKKAAADEEEAKKVDDLLQAVDMVLSCRSLDALEFTDRGVSTQLGDIKVVAYTIPQALGTGGYVVHNGRIQFTNTRNARTVMHSYRSRDIAQIIEKHRARLDVDATNSTDDMIEFLICQLVDAEPRTLKGHWWCETHKRVATGTNAKSEHCCDPRLGGITIPCDARFISQHDNDPGSK